MRELSLHILDIVQNAVAAGATEVTITLEEDPAEDWLRFVIGDNGRGMDEETVRQVTDPFFTTRTTRRVGLGLPMLSATAAACGGGMTITSRVGCGTTVQASFRLGHIDRPPLGDMVSTLLAILLGNEEIAYHYTHRVGEREFTFRSAEMKEILEDVSFQEPAVYQWLQAFFSEGEGQLYDTVV